MCIFLLGGGGLQEYSVLIAVGTRRGRRSFRDTLQSLASAAASPPSFMGACLPFPSSYTALSAAGLSINGTSRTRDVWWCVRLSLSAIGLVTNESREAPNGGQTAVNRPLIRCNPTPSLLFCACLLSAGRPLSACVSSLP